MLVSCFFPSPTSSFEGFCFAGSNYIAGAQGADAFERKTDQRVEPGLDGCYVVANSKSYGWELGTDSRGLGRLFVYQKDGIWAVGSSLYILVQHLRNHRIRLQPNLPILRAMSIRSSLTQQQLSRQTIFSNIILVATNDRIQINGMGPQIVRAPLLPEMSYKEALSDYLNIWRSRLQTLVQDEETVISADLSGGLDSRVVFAFLASVGASKMGGDRFRLVSNRNRSEDYRAAERVANEFDIQLNEGIFASRTQMNYSNALSSWKETCLGSYLPVTFRNRDFDPLSFQAHGAGGENYRNYFAPGRGPDELERLRKYFSDDEFEEWRSQVDSELNSLSTRKPHVDPRILHYREFRNRMHFGHRPHRRAMFMPLNSLYLDRVYDRIEPLQDRQVYFDIMESLAPGLMNLPYDVSSKAPTQDNLAKLTIADVDANVKNGQIYLGSLPDGFEADLRRNAYQQWLDEADAALRCADVCAFLGEAAVLRAKSGLTEARQALRPLGANNKGILELSYALTVKFALG